MYQFATQNNIDILSNAIEYRQKLLIYSKNKENTEKTIKKYEKLCESYILESNPLIYLKNTLAVYNFH